MWRRRPIVRRPGRMPAGVIINPRIPPLVVEANQLFDNGRYLQAGNAFEKLAVAAALTKPKKVIHLKIRAGKSFFLGGNELRGLNNIKEANDLMTSIQSPQEFIFIWQNLGRWAEENHFSGLSSYLKQAWINHHQIALNNNESANIDMPSFCPNCGAPIKPENVSWEAGKPYCEYCDIAIN